MGSPSYTTNDPLGWGGDPSRGAALGRSSIRAEEPESFRGKLTLRRIRIDSGGYDSNGTYFGFGAPLYWYACEDENGETIIDDMIRADSREGAKEKIRAKYPNARFYR